MALPARSSYIASVAGRQFELPALVKLFNDLDSAPEDRLSEDRFLEALEEALESRIGEEVPIAAGAYQFSHALIRDIDAPVAESLARDRALLDHQALGDLEGMGS